MGRKEKYKQFWLSLFENRFNYVDINNAFEVLFDKNLEGELEKIDFNNQNESYKDEYETWMKRAQEFNNKKKLNASFILEHFICHIYIMCIQN